jgi:hypothetical protein
MNYKEYLELGTIEKVSIIEKKDIRQFLEYTYIDNKKTSQDLCTTHPRWSIISGYYAMHDISRLYLLLRFDIKITKPSAHDAVIKALRELVKKKELVALLEEAQKDYSKIQRLDYQLSKGKEHREKTQYYTLTSFNKEQIKQKAKQFFEEIVVSYIEILERLLEKEQ